MKIILKLQKLKLDKDRFNKIFYEALEVQIRQAAREWLRAVILKVPQYSGMAAGSLIPLGQYLRVAVPISVNPSAREHGHKQTAADGAALGGFQFNIYKKSIKFTFSTHVMHYIANEFHHSSLPLITETPWHSFQAGEQAFNKYLDEHLQSKLPQLKDYIIRETEVVG